jgi:hypothetical protein
MVGSFRSDAVRRSVYHGTGSEKTRLLPRSHPSQHGVHLGRCLLLLVRKHVGIDVEGDGGGGVTQPPGHDPDGYTGLE